MRPPQPSKRARGHSDALRRRVAVEAARLIAEQGMRDYHDAKVKAAYRLGLGDDVALPRNAEIEEALREHQRLFQMATQPQHLRRLREAAIEALRFFTDFQPRLVGAVLDGTADEYSAVCLHLFTDNVREVVAYLDNQGIPLEEESRRVRITREREEEYPALAFSAGGTPVDLTIFPIDGLRHPPLDRTGDRPMRRAGLNSLLELIEHDTPP
jgi:hypothetical protein